jgi:hypothetical protein
MSRMHLPAKLSLAVWFWALALAFGAQEMSAASVTYIVGTCKSGTQFSTIQSALDASPAPNAVEVCPATYSEQVTISHPVTLEGIAEGNGSLAQIELPSNYTINASVIAGGSTEPAIAQIYVNDVSGGSLNLTNLNVNGVGFGSNDSIFIEVLYNQSSGTINQVTTSAQNTSGGATNVDGWGNADPGWQFQASGHGGELQRARFYWGRHLGRRRDNGPGSHRDDKEQCRFGGRRRHK